MDWQTLSNHGTPNYLLTLPREDLVPSSSSTQASFRLLQLPPGWNADDLMDARFVMKPQQQVALVSEKKEMSFFVSNVQSSNCLVLLPPPLQDDDDDDDDDDESVSQKKQKRDEHDQPLRTIPTRLLQPGGSGATFLELRPKVFQGTELQKALRKAQAVLDPQESSLSTTGITVEELALELQHSGTEIRRGLWGMEGVFVYTNDRKQDSVLLLSEETQMNVQQAIVATLAETCPHYAEDGVPVEECVQWIVERMSPEERFARDREVVRYCLVRLAQTTMDDEEAGTVVTLDVAKVAKWVARQLFSLQSTTPWEESLLLTRWQAQTPGVGDAYRVSVDMLRGIAVRRPTAQSFEWKYLPADPMMNGTFEQVEDAFALLFEWKEGWELDELQPYLDAMVDATATSQSDILLQYLKVVVTVDGRKMFMKR